MRALMRVFTALPLTAPSRPEGAGTPGEGAGDAQLLAPSWSLAPLVGLFLGVVAFVAQQVAIEPVGPLVAGVLVVAALAAVTGAVGYRSLGELGLRLAHHADDSQDPPARPTQLVSGHQFVVTILILLQVTLLQRVGSAPQLLLMVPVAGVLAQSLLLTDADDVPLTAPGTADRVSATVLALLMTPLPLALAQISRMPFGFESELAGPQGVVLAAVALAVGVLAGMLTRAWALARFERLDTAGWRVVGLIAETTALLVVAVRIA